MAQLKNRTGYEGLAALEEFLQILREQDQFEVLIQTTLHYLIPTCDPRDNLQ